MMNLGLIGTLSYWDSVVCFFKIMSPHAGLALIHLALLTVLDKDDFQKALCHYVFPFSRAI